MNPNRTGAAIATALLSVAVCSAPAAFAQDQDRPPEPGAETQDTAHDGQAMGPGMGQASPEMREMARSMKSMADMCQTMMQREMEMLKYRPIWITAAAVVGALLAVALVLFVVLEIQWIRFFAVRIKTERHKLG